MTLSFLLNDMIRKTWTINLLFQPNWYENKFKKSKDAIQLDPSYYATHLKNSVTATEYMLRGKTLWRNTSNRTLNDT